MWMWLTDRHDSCGDAEYSSVSSGVVCVGACSEVVIDLRSYLGCLVTASCDGAATGCAGASYLCSVVCSDSGADAYAVEPDSEVSAVCESLCVVVALLPL